MANMNFTIKVDMQRDCSLNDSQSRRQFVGQGQFSKGETQ